VTQADGLEDVLAAHGRQKDRLVVRLSEYQGHRLLDIRRWYVTAGSKEWKPTTKGISLTRDAFEFVLTALQADEKVIHKHFAGEDDTHLRAGIERDRQAKSAERAGFGAKPYAVQAEEWSGPEFFRLDGQGAKDILLINGRHVVGKALLDAGPPEVVALLLLSFGRACRLADGGTNSEASETLELLSANWGFILRQYLAEPRR
jgi:hypothetical protein